MTWAAVRDRYMAVYSQTGSADIGWHLAIGHYVANRWLAEDRILQGNAYDPALTDPVWDDQLTLSDLERIEKDAIDALKAHLAASQRTLDHDIISAALRRESKLSREWFGKTLLEGPISALGVVLAGFVLLLVSALFLSQSRAALGDLFGAILSGIGTN